MVDNKLKKSKQDSEKLLKYLKISFFETIDLIEDWALKESYKHITVKDQLKVTQTDCESLISSHKGQEISVHLEELAKNLETLQKSLKKPKKNPEQNLEDLQQKGLKDIFEFYSKQTKQIGQFPTFTELNDHQSVLNLSKFTKFCSDFELISTIKDKYKIPLSHLSNIFLKATNCKRIMSFSSFLLSIDYLADDFYSENYDRYFNEKLSILTTELKRKKLLIFLKCNDPKTYSLKLKGFGSAFSLEKKGYRIPDYDLSKKYKFKDQSKVKEKIENWKNQKKEAVVPSRSNSVPSYARIRAIQQSLLTRPDRITWDLLNKNLNFITREDLEKLFEADDIRELIKEGVKVV